MASTIQEHKEHVVVWHDANWSGCKTCKCWIDTRKAQK